MLLCDNKSSSKVSGSHIELLGIHKYLVIKPEQQTLYVCVHIKPIYKVL